MNVSFIVRRKNAADLKDRVVQLTSGIGAPAVLTRKEFADRYGADDAAVAEVRRFAVSHGLSVLSESSARCTIIVSGTPEQFSNALCLPATPIGGRRSPGAHLSVSVPSELEGAVEAILGLDTRAIAAPRND